MTTAELISAMGREGLPVHKDKIQRAINGGFLDPPPEKNEKGQREFRAEHIDQLREYLSTVRRGRPSKKRDGNGKHRQISQPGEVDRFGGTGWPHNGDPDPMTATTPDVHEDLPFLAFDSAPPKAVTVRQRAYDLTQEFATAWDAHPLRKHAEVSSAILEPFEKLVELFASTQADRFLKRDWPVIARFADACQQMALARIDLRKPEAWGRHNIRGPLHVFVQKATCFLEDFDEPTEIVKRIETIEELEQQGVGDWQICQIQAEVNPAFAAAERIGQPLVLRDYRKRRAAGEKVTSGGEVVVKHGARIPEPDLFPIQTLRKQIRVLNSNAGK